MGFWFKEKIEKVLEPKTTTLKKFHVHFTTIDGKEHIFTRYNYVDEESLTVSAPEYIMHSVKSDGYLKDDDDVMYPLQNIISIKWEEVEKIENVIVKYIGGDFSYTYYPKKMIEIYEKGLDK